MSDRVSKQTSSKSGKNKSRKTLVPKKVMMSLVGSLLCSERFFSEYSGFPVLKTNTSKFQFKLECSHI